MTDLIRGAVGEARGFRAVRRDLPEVEFIVEDDRSVVFRPAGDAERRFLLDRKVGLAVNEGGGGSLGDVDDGVRGGIDGPKVVVAEIKKVAAARAFFKIVIVPERILKKARAAATFFISATTTFGPSIPPRTPSSTSPRLPPPPSLTASPTLRSSRNRRSASPAGRKTTLRSSSTINSTSGRSRLTARKPRASPTAPRIRSVIATKSSIPKRNGLTPASRSTSAYSASGRKNPALPASSPVRPALSPKNIFSGLTKASTISPKPKTLTSSNTFSKTLSIHRTLSLPAPI